jgi:hypothetical protein
MMQSSSIWKHWGRVWMPDRKRNVAYMRSLYVSSALSPETKTSLGQLDIPKGILFASSIGV